MYDAAHILRLFEPRMRELEMSEQDLELQAFGKKGNTAIQSLKKGSIPRIDRVKAMADALGLDCYLGPRRIPSSQPGLAEDGNVVTLNPRKGWLPIPWHDDDPHPGAPPVAFDPVWVAHHQLAVERLAMVVPVRGGDTGQRAPRETLVMIDRHAARQGGPTFWALLDRKSVTLRMVQFETDVMVELPPRSGQPARLHHAGTAERPKPLGRVLWTGTLL